jgi:hypothetical protein
MEKKQVTQHTGEELAGGGFRELTDDETALVGGGMTDPPIIWPFPKIHGDGTSLTRV